MTLIELVIVLVVVGMLLWLVQTIIPMAEPMRRIVTAVVVVAVCIWLLSLVFGATIHLGDVRIR